MVYCSTRTGKTHTSPSARCRKQDADRARSAAQQSLPDPQKLQTADPFADTLSASGNTAVQVSFRPWATLRGPVIAAPSRGCFNTRCRALSPCKTALRRAAWQERSRPIPTALETSPVNRGPLPRRAKITRCQGYVLSVLEGRPGRAVDVTQRPTRGISRDPSRRLGLAAALNHKPRFLPIKATLTFIQHGVQGGIFDELVQKKCQNAEEGLASQEHIDIFKRNKAVESPRNTQAQGVHK
jgi:hypothetical protein